MYIPKFLVFPGTKTLSESERTELINHTCEKIDELLTKATNNSDLDIFLNSICLNFGIQLKQIKKWKKEAREIQKFLGTPYVLSRKFSKNMENFFNELNMDMKKFATRSEIVILNEAENEKFILSIMDNMSRDNVKITFQVFINLFDVTLIFSCHPTFLPVNILMISILSFLKL